MQKRQFTLRGRLRAIRSTAQNSMKRRRSWRKAALLSSIRRYCLPEGFTWEAYMRMAGAMLNECAEVCFLPDWTESRGAKYEFGEAVAQKKPFFFFNDWEAKQNAEK